MALTGTGIRIGSVEDFGANIRYARGLATDGTTVWLFDASRGYTLNTTTGAAFAVAPSVTGFDNSETTVRSATYHNSQVLVFGSSQGRIQVFDTTAGTLTNWHSNAISYAGSEGGVPALWGLTSLNGTLYALDRQVSALYTVSRVGVLTRVGDATAFGINSANPRGLTAYRNMLIGSDQGLGKIFVIDPVTGVGTIIGSTNTLPDDNAEALVEFDGQLLMAGSQNDALFRLYDVLWDETIAALEIDEGTSGTLLDLSTVSQDAVSFSLQGTPPSWLSISGNNLVATAAPDVTADTDYDVEVRATRDSVNADKTLQVAVRSTGVAVLSFGSETIANQSLSVDDTVNLTLPEATGGDPTIVYSLTPGTLPGGLTFNASTRILSGTPTGRFTSAEFTYTATDGNSDTVTLTFTIVVTADAITFSPASFANQSWTVGTAVDLTLPAGAGGVGDLTPSLIPALPAGVTFTASTRALAGNPTAAFSVATFTYTMTDAEGESESITFTIAVTAKVLVATTIVEISGDDQTDDAGATLDDPFIVEVRDQDSDALSGVTVTFTVTVGGGSLSATSVTTDASGRAQSTLTLGATATNTVTATASGITMPITFTATAAVELPGKVRGVGVTPRSRAMRLVWDAPDDGGNPIQRYEYQLDGGTWVSTGSDMPEFVLDGLENGTEYSVRLRARTASGVGLASAAVTATPAWPTPGEGCYLLDLVESDFTGYTAPELTDAQTVLESDFGEDVSVGLIRIQTDAETAIASVIVQGGGGNDKYVHLGELEIGAGEWHVLRFDDREVRALRLVIESVSTPANLHTIEVYTVRADLSRNVAGFSAEELQLGQNSYRRYDGVLVTSDGVRTVPRVELSLAKLTESQTQALTALMESADFYLLAGLSDRYRVAIATDALRFTGRRGAHSLSLSLAGAVDTSTYRLAIEMEGEDVSHLWIPEDGITISRSIDTPQLNTVKTDTLTFSVDNEDFDFEINQPDNFFLRHGLNRFGRNAQVLIKINNTAVFAGFVWSVQSDLQSTRVRVQVVDMFAYMAQAEIKDLGTQLNLEITRFPGAQDLYIEEDPVFPFPLFALPIVPGSVTATMSEEDATVDVEIVDVVGTTGELSNRNAEIDYSRGLIRFEAPPLDGEDTQITAQWLIALQNKRPDTLVRLTLENTGVMDRIGITPPALRGFSIEGTSITVPSNTFSSHGRPFVGSTGITRWLKWDATNKKMYLAQDSRLLEYDEASDEYDAISTTPDDDSITEVPPGGYGTLIEEDNSSLLDSSDVFFTVFNGRFYTIYWVNGEYLFYFVTKDLETGEEIDRRYLGINGAANQPRGMAIFEDRLWLLFRQVDGQTSVGRVVLRSYELGTLTQLSSHSFANGTGGRRQIVITSDRILMGSASFIYVLDRQYNELARLSPNGANGMATEGQYIYHSHSSNEIRVYDFEGTEIESLRITRTDGGSSNSNLSIDASRLYLRNSDDIYIYSVSQNINYHGFSIYQFDTTDFDSFYMLTTNTLTGDILTDVTYNRVRLQKYVKSTDTWSTLLDADNGEPQLAMPYDFGDERRRLADNRKNFEVVRRNNKTLIFYRRVTTDDSGISVFNETDDTITDIYSESHDTSPYYGLPYSMDFAIDEQSDGIHVYTFVVRYTSTEATLKIYRKRIEPSGNQTEIFSETFTISSDAYPISVNDVILSDGRSKWYFVLGYYDDDDEIVARAELCVINKDGSGSRTVLKTYDNPFLSARSPIELDGAIFYLEGGWVRRPKTTEDTDDTIVPDDEHYYPNDGGNLIEIETNNDITDHGLVWRSATEADSPEPSSEDRRYAGWGRHNAIISNTIVYDSSLRVIAGYGLGLRVSNNLPLVSDENVALDFTNFVQIGWGRELAGKIPSFPVSNQRGLPLLQSLAALGFANIGVSPTAETDARLAGETVTDWQRLVSIYYRGRNDAQLTLRTAVGTGSVSQLDVDAVGLPNAGEVLFGAEVFAYTSTVTQGGVISELQGVTRGQNGSPVAAHSADDIGVRVDSFIDAGDDSDIYTISGRVSDFINQKNRVSVSIGTDSIEASETDSIDDYGEFTLSIGSTPVLLSQSEFQWAEILANTYLDSLKEPKEVLTILSVLDLSLQVGQVVVVNIDYRIKIGFKAFVVTQVAHQLPQSTTEIRLREV